MAQIGISQLYVENATSILYLECWTHLFRVSSPRRTGFLHFPLPWYFLQTNTKKVEMPQTYLDTGGQVLI